MDTQEEVFDIIKSLNENRQLLSSVYNVYQNNFETFNMQKMQMFEIYEQVLSMFDEVKILQNKNQVLQELKYTKLIYKIKR